MGLVGVKIIKEDQIRSKAQAIMPKAWAIVPKTWAIIPKAWAIIPKAWAIMPKAWAIMPKARAIVPKAWAIIPKAWALDLIWSSLIIFSYKLILIRATVAFLAIKIVIECFWIMKIEMVLNRVFSFYQ